MSDEQRVPDSMQRVRLARGGRGGDTPPGKFELAASGLTLDKASPESPQYRKQEQSLEYRNQKKSATKMFMIVVDEGWRSWILCTDMYEWAADDLLGILHASNHRWP